MTLSNLRGTSFLIQIFIFNFFISSLYGSYVAVDEQNKKDLYSGEGPVCLGKNTWGPWEVCRFPDAVVDQTLNLCRKPVCVRDDLLQVQQQTWGVLYHNAQVECRSARMKKQHALVFELKYTQNTFFHFVCQVLMKIYVAMSELYMDANVHIVVLGNEHASWQINWLELITKNPVRTSTSSSSVIESQFPTQSYHCYKTVSVLRIDDWFDGGFHLLHLEWQPKFAISSFADFMHARAGSLSRTLQPSFDPLKVVYIWRDRDRSAQNRLNRLLVNQEDVIEALRRYRKIDLQVVKLQDLQPAEQLKTLENAGLLIGSHGAGMVNMVFLPRCAGVIEIFPQGTELLQHPANTFVNVAHISGKHYFPYISEERVDPGFETIDIRKMSTKVVVNDFIRLVRKVVDALSYRCGGREGDSPMFGLQTVPMGKGSMKFAEQIDDAKK
mmetsp:Transcript_23621/g.32238  ORF Transcript_23621/g.32238 Transcript_23621/m.32238 type:complete len:440 (-) Transcript_23621:261-1580(-)|eukprot:CAMPEP_0201482624 /NCGR_PEP_ID=MMETSP0151_2-20130828/6894_1 /ASSEMBLY_ACC=CAM_ASM_000257 /TAXON_ID=200890 /ORGANISM="Paramoeba atlantica, Strain 621/1 / CCAP 1560/9" /LENGTH=439 /DNA_ID=CAMNT_0047865403 /DNA_START=84 /DNA_END=1403 /DNA_ORIENTATION=-